MLHRARERHGNDPRCRFVGRFDELEPADYAVASGVMNVKLEFELETWEEYVRRTIAELDAVGSRGFSFNLLTKYSDADRMRENLYYADPLVLFDHCKRTYSKYVALLHDYPLYEFTMLVRKPRP